MDLSVQGKSGPKTDAFGRKISDGRLKLRSWLNKQMRIEMSDGRILLGIFLCTDRDGNVILGSCTEYINPDGEHFLIPQFNKYVVLYFVACSVVSLSLLVLSFP